MNKIERPCETCIHMRKHKSFNVGNFKYCLFYKETIINWFTKCKDYCKTSKLADGGVVPKDTPRVFISNDMVLPADYHSIID